MRQRMALYPDIEDFIFVGTPAGVWPRADSGDASLNHCCGPTRKKESLLGPRLPTSSHAGAWVSRDRPPRGWPVI